MSQEEPKYHKYVVYPTYDIDLRRSYNIEPSDLNGPLRLFNYVSNLNRLISNE
jgi:hypothetical protein